MLNSNKIDFIALSKALNKLLLIGFVLSLVVSITLALGLLSLANNKSRTLVPPSISKAFTVSDGTIDESYASQMAEYILYLKLNVTPANVERQFSQLLDYANADAWSSVQPQLVRESVLIKKSNLSSTFSVSRVEVAMDSLIVNVHGVLNKSVGDRALTPVSCSYLIYLKYEQGTLTFSSIKKEAQS
ncbi:conjugative transfer protein TraE (plasmid) [Aliivibrio salmonicida LFI1238]|uniref:Conjugative transfer protein TraE n=1 Tax=Aliivibrio salmonicida (strain LFI1238) TaxID=316275 RepID=B6ESX5_ALISL|nr:type IV conjugative transfer system protein TraE [Aliivibrio salmonicida]CAQ81863.1 conjugative transfer protein TraE [Aliivibrio salmonicida LFI1238]